MADDLEQLVLSISADTAQMRRALKRLEGETGASTRKIERQFANLGSKIGGSFDLIGRNAKNTLSALGLAFGIREAQGFIDAATRIENALKVAGLSGSELTRVYDKLFESAQRNAAPLEGLATLYSRVSAAQKELGVSSDQILSLTDTVAASIRLTGGDSEQAAGALLQLGQALGGGKVQAEEFNSLLDGMRPLLQAAAAGIKQANGSVSELTRLVKEGELSSRALFDGIDAGSSILQSKLAGATFTASQGFQRLRNAITKAAGDFDKGTEASKKLGSALEQLAVWIASVNFDNLLSGLGKYTGWVETAINLTKQLGDELGRLTGLNNVGQMVAESGLGQQLGLVSEKKVRERITGAFDGVDKAVKGALTPEAIKASYMRSGTNTTPKTSRLPKIAPVNPIDLDDPRYTVPGGGGGGGSKSRQNEFQREVEQIKERTAALQAETAAQAGLNPLIEDFGYAAEKARATQDLLNAAKQAGLEVTPKLTAEIERLASKYSGAEAAAQGLKQAQDDARDAIEAQKDAYKDLGDTALDAGQSLADALDDGKLSGQELLQILFDVGKQLLSMKDIGSIFGNIFSALTGGGINYFQPGLYASGGRIAGPGTGKSDSIPIMASNGEYMVNAAATRKFLPLLEAINGGTFRGFADGGQISGAALAAIPRAPAVTASPGNSVSAAITYAPTFQGSGNRATDQEMMAAAEKMFERKFMPQLRQALVALKHNTGMRF